MKYLPFIVPAYGLAIAVPLWLASSAWRRLKAARRALRDIDPARAP